MKLYLKKEASPGVPCAITAVRNDTLLEKLGERFNDLVLDRIELMMKCDLVELEKMDRRERIDLGLLDPVRVFVKNEPHKREKVETGRVRLIMSVSLIDKMIEMLLSRHLCKLEIQNWKTIPSKPGIGFTEEDCASVYSDVANSGLEMSYSDIQGWDWGVKAWQILDEAESILLLAKQQNSLYQHLIRVKALLETSSVFQFSDGLLVAPDYDGIVCSGKLRTSRGNSWMRVRIADLIGSKKIIAAGDDAVEHTVPNAKEKYLSYGIRCKAYEPVVDQFEFCSRIYHAHGSHAINKEKMVMNILHNENETFFQYNMTMLALANELSTHPEYTKILEDLETVGYYEVEGPHY